MNEASELKSRLQREAGVLRALPLVPLWVTGDDRIDFLNRLLTQEIPDPGPRLSWAALCQAQGRVIALFRLGIRADAAVLLLEEDLASRVRDVLGRYILRSRVRLELGNPGEVGGFWTMREQKDAPPLPSHDSLLGEDPSNSLCTRYLVYRASREGASVQPPDPLWLRTDFWLGIPRILAETSEQFVPHALHLTEIGAISLRKGCYPGQEVIARTEYRGRIKRSLVLFETETIHPPGAPLMIGDLKEPVGTVLDSIPLANSATWTQAVVSDEFLDRIPSSSGTRLLKVFRPA